MPAADTSVPVSSLNRPLPHAGPLYAWEKELDAALGLR